MYLINGKNFSEAYIELLKEIMTNGSQKAPRGQNVKYFQNCLFEVKDPRTTFSCPTREYNWKYLNNELKLYFSGDCSAEKFGEASKFWLKLANPDGNINSNYGYLVFYKSIMNKFGFIKNQWTYAKNQLIADKDTRQALIFISSPHVQFDGNKDFICTLNYTFNINDDVLGLTVNRRSQDCILGIPYDFIFEYLLLEKMYNELKETYPTLKLGTYTMFCNNIHIYERNWEMVSNMIADYKVGNYENQVILNNIDENVMSKYVMNKEFGN